MERTVIATGHDDKPERAPNFSKAIEKLDAESFGRLAKMIEQETARRKKQGSGAAQMSDAEFEKWKTEQIRNAELAHQADSLRGQLKSKAGGKAATVKKENDHD